ncbi:N-acetylmuramoyl-L-alanine amidase [Lacrimispora sp.]|uniref:peptidoglycan recognition protein family protein n=1 Tax=Lacrimispora sp. TaxID=2719234 RepID=UPI0034608F99
MIISKQFINVSNYNRPGTKRKSTTAVACHYIGNPGTSAQRNRDYFESLRTVGPQREAKGEKATKASCHYLIGLDGEIVQLIPEDEVSWCTNSANSYTISIEACHPDATGKFTEATYKSYVELCADICSRWGLDPLHGGLIRHYDVTRKVCPKWFVDNPKEWQTFKEAVAAKMNPSYEVGWNHDSNGWWYADSESTYYKSCWQIINGHRYRFNSDGYALTGWQVIDGKDFYFEPRAGHPLECALYMTDAIGVQGPGEF